MTAKKSSKKTATIAGVASVLGFHVEPCIPRHGKNAGKEDKSRIVLSTHGKETSAMRLSLFTKLTRQKPLSQKVGEQNGKVFAFFKRAPFEKVKISL